MLNYLLLFFAFATTAITAFAKSDKAKGKSFTIWMPILIGLGIFIVSMFVQRNSDFKAEEKERLAKATSAGVDSINKSVENFVELVEKLELELKNNTSNKIDNLNYKIELIEKNVDAASRYSEELVRLKQVANEISQEENQILKRGIKKDRPIVSIMADNIEVVEQSDTNNIKLRFLITNTGPNNADSLEYDGIVILNDTTRLIPTRNFKIFSLGQDFKSNGLEARKQLSCESPSINKKIWEETFRAYFIINVNYYDSIEEVKVKKQYRFRYTKTGANKYSDLINKDVINFLNALLKSNKYEKFLIH